MNYQSTREERKTARSSIRTRQNQSTSLYTEEQHQNEFSSGTQVRRNLREGSQLNTTLSEASLGHPATTQELKKARSRLVVFILKLFYKQPRGTKPSQKVIELAMKIEEMLFQSAPSIQEHLDLRYLPSRTRQICSRIIQSYTRNQERSRTNLVSTTDEENLINTSTVVDSFINYLRK